MARITRVFSRFYFYSIRDNYSVLSVVCYIIKNHLGLKKFISALYLTQTARSGLWHLRRILRNIVYDRETVLSVFRQKTAMRGAEVNEL